MKTDSIIFLHTLLLGAILGACVTLIIVGETMPQPEEQVVYLTHIN